MNAKRRSNPGVAVNIFVFIVAAKLPSLPTYIYIYRERERERENARKKSNDTKYSTHCIFLG